MNRPRYEAQVVNAGERSVVLDGPFVKAVFILATHDADAVQYANWLNEVESENQDAEQ
jgi:hypothetical protein